MGKSRLQFACLFVAAVSSACGGGESPQAPRGGGAAGEARRSRDERSTAVPVTEQKPIDPTSVGSVRGVVLFEGEAPERRSIDTSAVGGCHEDGEVLTEQAIVNDGRLQNVFVRVKGGLDGWIVPPAPSEPVVLDQNGCVYRPHVMGVRVGQPLQVKNSDQANHNVNARPKRRANEAFNTIQPPGGQPVETVFGEEEVAVRFECNLHPWMNAWVAAVDHPFFAVSAADGTFTIEGLPPGDYELEAWHERYKRSTTTVSVTAGAAAEVSFTFSD